MSPTDDEFGYDIEKEAEVRVAYSYGAALYAVRRDLTRLHRWSGKRRYIGDQFFGIFGALYESLGRARTNDAAAAELRAGLIEGLRSADLKDKDEIDLRDSLLSALRIEEPSPTDDPFRIIFEKAKVSAQSLYGDDWPVGVRCRCQAIENELLPRSGFWVNAVTSLDIDDPTVPPTVRLRINPENLNIKTYAALYAICVHECFCHVPAHRVAHDNESLFAEGFCDWGARKLFDRWLTELDPSLRGAARKFGEELWVRSTTKEDGNPYWDRRSIGHEAAERVKDMFIADGASLYEAECLVIRLARELVVADADLESKNTFVSNIGCLSFNEDLRRRLRGWCGGLANAKSLLQADLP